MNSSHTERTPAEIADDLRQHWGARDVSLPEKELVALTALLDEHPEWWTHACMCAECRSYSDG